MKTCTLREKFGYTLAELLLVTSIVGILPISVYLEAQKQAKTTSCMSNLRNIYMAVQMYEMDYGRLPDVAFYPKDARKDKRSILNVLRGYIDDRSVYLCPVAPDELKKRQITYIWNDLYNNKLLDKVRMKSVQWLMTEMTAVEPKIPPPHQGGYNVLFFDGHVATVKEEIPMSPTVADIDKVITEHLYSKR